MPTLVADCPRCGANEHTFDVLSYVRRPERERHAEWVRFAEVFSVCRNCIQPTIFSLRLVNYERRREFDDDAYWTSDNTLNQVFDIQGFIALRHSTKRRPPEFTPVEIAAIFTEGAACLAIECWNAAGTMFRLCIDLATKAMLPPRPVDGEEPQDGAPNRRQRRDLGLRIPWLIATGRLPAALGEIADVVKEDGNDGAHEGILTKVEAEDLADFTEVLLERLYTEPGRIAAARQRRTDRHNPA